MSHRGRCIRISLMPALAAMILGGCIAADEPEEGAVDSGRIGPPDVRVSQAFQPMITERPYGSTILWANVGNITHTLAEESGIFDQTLRPGERFSWRFSEAGTYVIRCPIHELRSTIIIRQE